MTRCTLLISVLLGLISSAWCQPEPALQPEAVFKLNVELVVVDAQVLTKKTGQTVRSLTPDDFQLYENGIQQHISLFSQDELPLSVVFLFDLTDSVRPVLKPLADGARRALQHLKPEDEAAVMVYAAKTQLLQNFTTDRALIVKAIQKAGDMDSPEAAFFNEGVFQAATLSGKGRRDARRVIIWLTDNQPNIPSEEVKRRSGRSLGPRNPHTENEALTELFKTGAVVCTLLQRSEISEYAFMRNLNDPLFMMGRRQFPPGDVYRYTHETGGQVMESLSGKKVSARLADLIDQIRTRYALGYHPAGTQASGEFHEIRLQLSPEIEKREGKLIVRTRHGYYR